MSEAATESGTVTLRQILAMPAVRRAVPEVLSGEDTLDRPVRWVHSGDVSYIAAMLKGGELLLTTGMGIGHGAEEQRRFAGELAERGVAGVALELGVRFKKVPQALINEATKGGLVVIAFHREVPFIEITEAVHSEIVDRQLGMLRRSEALHKRFFALALEGAGTPEILAALAELTRGAVFLERSGHDVIYHEPGPAGESEALAQWDAHVRGLRQAPAAIAHRVPIGDGAGWGRLVVLIEGREATEEDRAAVERAVEVIALALLRDREEESMRSRERGNFINDLLRGDFDEVAARARAVELGMKPRPLLVPAIISRSPRMLARADETASWARIWADVQRSLRDRSLAFIAGTREHEREMIFVAGIDGEESRDRIAGLVADAVTAACENRLGNAGVAVTCFGATARNWPEAAASIRALAEALPLAARLPERPWHDLSKPSLDQLLWNLRDNEELARFYSVRLEPLIEHDRKRRSNLVETLTAYCEHTGRKSETARALNIERQSLYHRLKRIEAILGTDLDDGETLTDLHLALRARRAASAS